MTTPSLVLWTAGPPLPSRGGHRWRIVTGESGPAWAVAGPLEAPPDPSRGTDLRLARRLRHPAIVPVLDGDLIGPGTGSLVFAAPAGVDLETRLSRGEHFSLEQVLRMALQVVPAMSHAHRRGILWADLAPWQLFLDDAGRWRVLGCGLLKHLCADAPADGPFQSATFTPPEQALGKSPSKRGDYYRLGVIVYYMLTGRPPFAGPPAEVMARHVASLPERPGHLVLGLPDDLDRVVMKMLAKDPAHRLADGLGLLQGFDRIWSRLERSGLVGDRPPLAVSADRVAEVRQKLAEPAPAPEPPTPVEVPSRRPYAALRAGMLLAALAFMVGLLWWTFSRPRIDAAEQFEKASALMACDAPDAWERAWTEYLEPLERSQPGRHEAALGPIRRRVAAWAEFKRLLARDSLRPPRGEGERLFTAGLGSANAGEIEAARRTFKKLADLAEVLPPEQRGWAKLAAEAAGKLDALTSDQPSAADRRALAVEGRRRIDELARNGDAAGAKRLREALASLYPDLAGEN